MIEVQDIVRCEASSGYTLIHLLQGKPVMSSRDLKTYHELLEEYDFFRIHDSHVISHFHIQKVLNEDGGVVVLTNDIRLPIARRRKSEFLEWLKGDKPYINYIRPDNSILLPYKSCRLFDIALPCIFVMCVRPLYLSRTPKHKVTCNPLYFHIK
jgi:hypothetical protein